MGVIQAGTHDVVVTGHYLDESSKGTPSVAVRFKDRQGDQITWRGWLTPGALGRTVDTLGVLGFDPTAHEGDLEVLHETELMVGAKASIVVEDEEYRGKKKPQVKWVNARAGGVPASKAKEIAGDWKAQLSRMKPEVVVEQAEAPEARGVDAAGADHGADSTEYDDDLPF